MMLVRRRPLLASLTSLVALSLLATSSTAFAPAGESFSGLAAKQQVDALAGQIGSRPAGSAAYDQAVQYAADQLRQWGYQPSLQTFPVQTYDDRGSQLEVTAPDDSVLQISATTLTYSVGGQVAGPLAAVGLGQTADLDGVDLHGKLALVQRGVLRFSDKVNNAAAAGALGVIVFNDSPGDVQGSLVGPGPVPAATISGASGQQLLGLLAAGPVSARLAVDASIEQRSATNVLAELPGSRADAGAVIFGAHLDSVSAGPGANDNGSGSAVVLELAHLLAQRSPAERPLTTRFALWGAEEIGLFGSRHYVQNLSDAERQALLADINLDMVGVGNAWRFGGTDDLVQRALGAATEIGQRGLPLRGPPSSASDHASFLEAGVPAVFLYRVEDPNYHTANDRPEFVDPDTLAQAGTIALAILDGLAAD
jgi:aminopeptidase YwaD